MPGLHQSILDPLLRNFEPLLQAHHLLLKVIKHFLSCRCTRPVLPGADDSWQGHGVTSQEGMRVGRQD